MNEDLSPQNKLSKMLDNNSFEHIDEFIEPTSWNTFDRMEKQLLAMLFVKQGEDLLEKQDVRAFESFDRATKIAPECPLVFHAIGTCCFSHHKNNFQFLIKASAAFEKAIQLNPSYYEAWYFAGAVNVEYGLFHEDINYFYEADKRYRQAYEVANKNEACFFWEWGRAWFYIGKHSGEAVDFRKALDYFHEAAELGCQEVNFWNDYGDATIELGFLIDRRELVFDAIGFYRNGLNSDPTNPQGWFNLAACFHLIFEINGEDQYFKGAVDSFEKAVQFDSTNANLWMRWAQLLVSAGKIKRNVEYLEISLDKFTKADELDPHNSYILSRWGEALMLLGTNTEQLFLLREAHDKIIKSLQRKGDNVEVWHLLGNCLNEFGRYFHDEKYYLEAIEKFQYGLSLNQNDPLLWYGMALSHYAVGDIRGDQLMLEKAIKFCNRMLEHGGQVFPQFWNDWGVALMRLGEMTASVEHIEMAIDKFEQALQRHAEATQDETVNPEWLYNYGCALDFLGDLSEDVELYEKAIHVLSKALDLDPEYSDAHYNLALAYSHLGETTNDAEYLQKAVDHFQLMLAQDSEDELAWNDCGVTHIHLGYLKFDATHPEHAVKQYEQAEAKLHHAVGLGSLQAFYNLACVSALMGRQANAMHYLERAEAVDALPMLDDMLHDEWLESLRQTPAFRDFVTLISGKEKPL